MSRDFYRLDVMESVLQFCLSVRYARISLMAMLPFLTLRAAPGLTRLQRGAVKKAKTKTRQNTVECSSGHQGPWPSSASNLQVKLGEAILCPRPQFSHM